MSEERGWTPAFEGQRPPFPTRHGAFSPRRVLEVAERIEVEVAAAVPGYNDSHAVTVKLLARELARIELADAWLDEHGILDAAGKPAGILKMRSVWTNSAARLANDLALNPTAQAKLGVNVARARGEALRVHLDTKYGEGG